MLGAAEKDSGSADAALESLCRTYWHPLYAYVRRRGHAPADAQDLTQEFFVSLLARWDVAQVHPRKGRFRTFLLACLDHFLANDWHKRRTLKRGRGQLVIPLDLAGAEESLAADLSADPNLERLFDRRWAATVLEHAVAELRRELVTQGKEAIFDELNIFLSEPAGLDGYDTVAARLGMTPGAVATSVHRLRQRYREVVRATLAHTVTTPLELEEEMRYLLEVCG